MFWHIYVVCFQPNLPWSIDHFPAGCWHWRLAWCFFCICLGLLTVGSSQVQSQNWKQLQLKTNHETNHVWNSNKSWNKSCLEQQQIMKQIMFGTECWYFFCGKMLGKSPVFFDWAMFFLVRLTVTVGFGPVDGWFLTGPNSKLERVSASWQQITFGTECWIFFRGKRLGKSPVFWLGYAFLFGEADGGTLQIICMCFLDSFGPVDGGFLTGPKIKIEKKPFFKGQSAVLYHEYHTPCAPAQNTHHAYHFQIGSTIKITQTQSPRLQFLDWPTPPRWPFPGSIRSGGGADEED